MWGEGEKGSNFIFACRTWGPHPQCHTTMRACFFLSRRKNIRMASRWVTPCFDSMRTACLACKPANKQSTKNRQTMVGHRTKYTKQQKKKKTTTDSTRSHTHTHNTQHTTHRQTRAKHFQTHKIFDICLDNLLKKFNRLLVWFL